MERAQGRAEEYGVPRACSTEEVMDDPEIELVLNLTTPDGHYEGPVLL
jgi:predicted dehydrogenase